MNWLLRENGSELRPYAHEYGLVADEHSLPWERDVILSG